MAADPAPPPAAWERPPLDRTRAALTGLLLVGGMLLSGGPGLLANALVEALGLAILAVLVAQGPIGATPRGAMLLLGLIAAIALAQFLPLPPALWAALPGRALPDAILREAGVAAGWRPLSLDPDASLRSALSLLPAFAIVLSVARAPMRERVALAGAVVAVASLSALLGVFQFTAGALYPYETPHQGAAVGLFNNRNQNADLLLAAMPIGAALARLFVSPRNRLAAAVGIGVLALCCLSTTSRMGIAMLPAVAIASAALLWGGGSRARWRWPLVGAGAVALAALLAVSPVFRPVFERFGVAGEDARLGFWRDVAVAIRQFLPVGSGLGTFVPVFATVEDLDTVSELFVNHAHNDYLEIVLETGVAGLAAVIGYFVVLGRSARTAVTGRDWPLGVAGLIALAVMLAHSVVEYPLRNFVLLLVFALANALATTRPARMSGV